MNWLFYLNGTEIEEPIGWDSYQTSIKRDDTYHGISFEAGVSSLRFWGLAYEMLSQAYDEIGITANVLFEAYVACDNYDYELAISGRLNMGKYKAHCGDICYAEVPIEQDSCELVLKSRMDQKVDQDSITGADGVTPLSDYVAMGVETELPTQDIPVDVNGTVAAAGEVNDIQLIDEPGGLYIRPTYDNQIDNSINDGQLIPSNPWYQLMDGYIPVSPVLLLNERPQCFSGTFEITVRIKGRFRMDSDAVGMNILMFTRRWNGEGDFHNDAENLDLQSLYSGDYSDGTVIEFDANYGATITLNEGESLYNLIGISTFSRTNSEPTMHVEFDPETSVLISAVKTCPPTDAKLYGIHEVLSHTAETVTNNCIRVKSSYFGRTDSEPFAFPEDGCGGLRTLTSGLKLRRATPDSFFVSLKELYEGLNAIDNIGMDVITDPALDTRYIMRVETIDFFYDATTRVLRHDAIPKADTASEEPRNYSRVLIGYRKWEVEQIKGLDEYNSTREYGTSIDTVNNTLDRVSNLVAGSYAIEVTRQQQFADSGGADTTYDNESFIICMQRSGGAYTPLEVETGNIDDPENIFSPTTKYNFRITPARNLMRWYKSIAAGWRILADTANKLFFRSGTGNFLAKGKLISGCVLELVAIQENQNIFVTNFADQQEATPIWENTLITYEYPMSLADYRTLKSNPYGYIEVQCGTGDFVKYWVQEVLYTPAKGMATFTLRKKYGL